MSITSTRSIGERLALKVIVSARFCAAFARLRLVLLLSDELTFIALSPQLAARDFFRTVGVTNM